jgi:23S rRNA pseudouridine1911/1915/1917 synthase
VSTPKIIYQDEAILIIDKPAGWIVNEASTVASQPVVQRWLKKLSYPIAKSRDYRSGIVHRLDKETSGLLMVAKTKETFEALQAEFKNRNVKKSYIALVHGKVEPKEGQIKTTVGRLPWRRDRFGVLPGGRESFSEYKVLNYLTKEKELFTLVEFYPHTGRTHQIRVHAKYIGYPIVADEFYAGRKTARKDRVWCPRLFLHAFRLSYVSPVTKKTKTVEVPLAEDLLKALKHLGPLS